MPWQCRLVGSREERQQLKDTQPDGRLPIGTMWYHHEGPPAGTVREPNAFLSVEYYRDHLGKRPALWVRLPNRDDFCLDSVSRDGRADGSGRGWTVTGDAPNVTVSPSINDVGYYHGWLQNGVLSEDVEGRTFPR